MLRISISVIVMPPIIMTATYKKVYTLLIKKVIIFTP